MAVISKGARITLLINGFNWATSKIEDDNLGAMIETSYIKESEDPSHKNVYFWAGVRRYCEERIKRLRRFPKSKIVMPLAEELFH